MNERPSDACPYPKPFTAEFNDCPTYQTRHAIVVDSNDRPLRTIWSCRHMETRQIPGESGHYYGGCQLGDHVGAVAALLDHPDDPADLALGSAQPLDHALHRLAVHIHAKLLGPDAVQ